MWCLAKVVDYADSSKTLDRIHDVVEVFGAVVGEVMEDVDAFNGSLATLFAPKDEIYPLVEMLADIWAFESFSVLCNEDLGISLSPGRKLNTVDSSTVTLPLTKIVSIVIGEEFRKVKEFRD